MAVMVSSPVAAANRAAPKSAFKPHHQRLRFRVAQADIELKHLRPRRCHHQAGVEKAGISRRLDYRLDNAVHDIAALGRRQNAGVGVRAHAAGVRAKVAIEDAVLWSCDGSNGTAVLPSERTIKLISSGPSKNSSITKREWKLRQRVSGFVCRNFATITPFPAARPSVLRTTG